MGGKTERPPLRIETLLLEPDQGRFSLLWRGALPCDKQVLTLTTLHTGVKLIRTEATS